MMPSIISADGPGPGACLDDLLGSRFLPPRWAARIWSVGELPSRLEHCARNLRPEFEWRAYGDADRIFFAIARVHAAKPNAQPTVAIDVYFLDEKAAVYCAGVWEYDRAQGWWLDDVLDLSYDCEHGWWFEDLKVPEVPTDRRAAGDRRTGGDRRISGERRIASTRRGLTAPRVAAPQATAGELCPSSEGERHQSGAELRASGGAELRQLALPAARGAGKLRRARP